MKKFSQFLFYRQSPTEAKKMDIDMELMGWFNVEKDDKDNVLIRGQETNGNTFTIRTRREKEVIELIKDLTKATADNKN